MGGHGSGRKPNLYGTTSFTPKRDASIEPTAKPLELVNLSGVGEALKEGPISFGTAGSVLFLDSLGNITQDNSNLFWDDTNNRLGIGNSTPGKPLDITGEMITSDYAFFGGAVGTALRLKGSDANNTIFQPATDVNLGITINGGSSSTTYIGLGNSTTGAELVVRRDGNVGIGTTTPDSVLEVSGTSNPQIKVTDSANSVENIIQSHSVGQGTIGTVTDHKLAFQAKNSTKMTLLTDGNFGIGTTSPLDILHVVSSSDAVPSIRRNTTTTGDLAGVQFGVTTGTTDDVYRAGVLTERRSDGNLDLHLATATSGNVDASDARLTILSDGKVGVGTTNPGRILDIVSSGNTGQLRITDETGATSSKDSLITMVPRTSSQDDVVLMYGRTDTSANIIGIGGQNIHTGGSLNGEGVQGATELRFFTVGSVNTEVTNSTDPNMVIDSSGNVGIGTGAPIGLLHTAADGSNDTTFARHSTDTSGTSITLRKSRGTAASPSIVSDGDDVGFLIWDAYDGGAYREVAGIIGEVDGTPGASDMPGRMVFYTTADGTASRAERMRITSAGDIGMGTSAPDAPLHVTNTSLNIPSINSQTVAVFSRSSMLASAQIAIIGTAFANSTINFGDQSDENVGRLLYNHDANYMAFYTNAGERMRLDSSGNLGIGTTSPSANADLTLEGGAIALKETTTPTADTNYGKVYTKTDNKLYFQDGAGTEHEISFV